MTTILYYLYLLLDPFHFCVMKSQVRCMTVRLVLDNKSIKTIMVPRPSYQTRLNQQHKLAQSKKRIIQ